MHLGVNSLGTTKRDAHLPVYAQIAGATTDGFTTEEPDSLLFLQSDGLDEGGYLNASAPRSSTRPPPPTAHRTEGCLGFVSRGRGGGGSPFAPGAISYFVPGYINRMLMAEEINEKFEQYQKPFREILADQSPHSASSTVESPDGSSLAKSCNSLSSCTYAAPSSDLGAVQTPPALEFSRAEFLLPIAGAAVPGFEPRQL